MSRVNDATLGGERIIGNKIKTCDLNGNNNAISSGVSLAIRVWFLTMEVV